MFTPSRRLFTGCSIGSRRREGASGKHARRFVAEGRGPALAVAAALWAAASVGRFAKRLQKKLQRRSHLVSSVTAKRPKMRKKTDCARHSLSRMQRRVAPRRFSFCRGSTCRAGTPRFPKCGTPTSESPRLRLGAFAWDRCSSFYFQPWFNPIRTSNPPASRARLRGPVGKCDREN